MKILFLLLLTVFVCEIICQNDVNEAEGAMSVTQESTDAKQQEIESKETPDSKPIDDDPKREGTTESARGDSTTNALDTDKKVETTTSIEKPRDDEIDSGEEGTVVEANPEPQPPSQPVNPFFVYNVPNNYWPGYPGYPAYPTYPGYDFNYPAYNPWQQQRAPMCPPGFTVAYNLAGQHLCQKVNIFHNLFSAAARL